MRAFGFRRLGIRRAVLGCLALAFLLAAIPADARTRRERKASAFKVALQPFSLVRDAVHAVAEPIVENAPRAVARVATAPTRIAATTSRTLPSADAHAESDEQSDEPVYTPAAVRAAQPVRSVDPSAYAGPIRVAYVTSQPARRAEPVPSSEWDGDSQDFGGEAPRDEQSFDADEEQESEPTPDTEWSGDRPTVSGSRAVLRNGIAYAPSRAPENVKNAIWAVNSLRRKPYVWGGGHRSFHDRGYDCSGAVSYALHYAGALSSPMPSTGLMDYGRRGRGKWITIYSRPGHTFAVIAGLRLDTTDFQRGGNTGPRWHVDGRDADDFVARHPAGL